MKITRTPSLIALAIYLILIGLTGLFGIHLGVLSMLVPLMALIAGVLILAGR
jgi:hypothetical protein